MDVTKKLIVPRHNIGFEIVNHLCKSKNIVLVNKDQLGLTLNIGFNTWNISLYQSIDSFFVRDTNSDISDLKQFRLGFIFYLF